jgi:hypothetical protein
MRTVDSRQQPLFDVRSFLGEPYPVGSFYWAMEHIADLIILREDFPEVDPTLGGKEGWCPVLKSKMVLIQRKEDWSDRRTVEAARSDLRVKAALNLGIEAEPPQQGTLSRHRQQMEDLGLDTIYIRRFATLLEALELLELDEPVAVDSVPIEGAGQVRDTYNLLGDGIRRGLLALAAEHDVDVLVVARSLQLADYLTRSVKGIAEIDWNEAIERREFLDRLVVDARRVQQALREGWTPPEGPNDGGGEPSESSAAIADNIDKLIEHDVEFDEDGNVSGIRQQPANDRLISLTDVDMRHGRKSASQLISGFKAQIVATLATGWILLVKVIQANRHDGKDLPELITTLRERGFWPLAWVGDHAYGILDNHVYVADLNASGVAPSIELIARNARPGNGGRFTKTEFAIDWSNAELTCPADKVAQRHYASRDGKIGWEFSFGENCVNCPLREQCVSPQAKATTGRTVFFVPKRELLLREHLVRREQPDFQELLKQRWRVEQANAGFEQCGGKTAQRMGQRAVEFDARLSALAHNLRKLGRMVAKDGELRERLQSFEIVRRDDGVFLFAPIARLSQPRPWRQRQLAWRRARHSGPNRAGTRRGRWQRAAQLSRIPHGTARPAIESCF